ncbi:hypothetical protein OEZ85_011140 [Tetradesmus obliquus]|uniref:UBX domain-containing protein n=1 Tax=Tetradesmus obliquus TaxID=3088 RepID=A0ABY8TT88_TETOB|nr:hypothetical protein OEZ85_011140 [Tetradesmus obliquus]
MYRPGRIAATGRGETLDDLVERNVLSLLKATGPNLAAKAPAPDSNDLVAGLVSKCPPLPYSSEAADSILSDIFDGYFPSALKDEFPDGTPIQLVDRKDQTLAQAAAAAAAAQKCSNIIGWQDLEQQQQQRGLSGLAGLSGQAFLDRLPKTVIRNQQVVSVRPAVEQFINGSSSSSSSSSGAAGKIYLRPSSCSGGLSRRASQGGATAAVGQQEGSAAANAGTSLQQQQQQATIQVKSEDGKQTYVLLMPYTATLAALRASIDKHRAITGAPCHICQQQQAPTANASGSPAPANGGPVGSGQAPASISTQDMQRAAGVCCGYELRSAFPARLYADVSMSLEQAGLVPSATLFMRHAAAAGAAAGQT